MAKRKTKKRPKKKKKSGGISLIERLPVKPIAVILIASALAAGVFFGIKYFFVRTGFFTIEDIVVNKDRGYAFSNGERKLKRLYIGRDIFSVLSSFRERLESSKRRQAARYRRYVQSSRLGRQAE